MLSRAKKEDSGSKKRKGYDAKFETETDEFAGKIQWNGSQEV